MSNEFLDKALQRRLKTISARRLVNALAKAERLGYDVQDIVEERENSRPEHVIPSIPYQVFPGMQQGQYPAGQIYQAAPYQPSSYWPILPRQSQPFPSPVQKLAQQPAYTPSESSKIVPSNASYDNNGSMTVTESLQSLNSRPDDGIVTCKKCRRPCSGIKAAKYV